MEAKYVAFEKTKENQNGICQWQVNAKQTGLPLGRVVWWFCWNQYVFAPDQGTYFEEDCLRDIASFVEEQTRGVKVGTKQLVQ